MNNSLLRWCFALVGIPLLLHGWRTWYFPDSGADSTGVGGAYTTSLTASPDLQPAATGFSGRPILVWDLSASLTVRDPFSGQYTLIPDPLPYLGFSIGNSQYGIGISLRRIIRSIGSDLAIYRSGLSGSWLLLPHLRVGGFVGMVSGTEYSSSTRGGTFSLGILWQINQNWRTGVSWQSLPKLEWSFSPYGRNVTEHFPSRFAIGISTFSAQGEWFGEISYTDPSTLFFSYDDITERPLFSPLTPFTFHLGWRGKLPWWNIPFHAGLWTDHLWTYPRPLRQWAFAVGLRAIGKNVQLSFTWVDSYLFSLFLPEVQPIERGLVSLSYLF
ncbi:MAG: hypothetical protein N2314_05125 [Brevinematales bacterium]|nr:hypothetical protein [Brevinematales bacterium]